MATLLTKPLFALALAGLIAPISLHAEEAAAPIAVEGDAGAYLAARVAGTENDYRAAVSWFARALEKDPENQALLEGNMISALGAGEMDTAIALAQKLSASGVTSQSATFPLLANEAHKGDWQGILDAAAKGRSIGALIDGLSAAWAQAGIGKMSEALDDFDSLAKADGLGSFAMYHKALAMASVGDYEGAEAIFAGPEGERIASLRRAVIARAQVLSQLERNPQAVEMLNATYPAGQDAGMDSLRARLTAGEALPYDIATNATQGMAEVFFTLATALNGQADNNYTLIHSRIASYLRPDHTEALLLTAGILNAQGQYDLAVETYAQVPADGPTFHIAEIGRSEALYASGKKEAAVEVLESLARSHGQIIAVQVALGDALRQIEQYEAAAKAYDAAITLVAAPTRGDWILFYSRAICHERQKRWPEAEADFQRALELSPNQPQVLNYLGYSYLERKENLDVALDMIERAVKAQPDSGYIQDSLAWALFQLGRYQEAVGPMEKASLLEPVDPVVTDHLGDVYWSVGRRLEAQFQWRRALSFNPEEKEAVRLRRKLEIGLNALLAEEGAEPLKAVETAHDGN